MAKTRYLAEVARQAACLQMHIPVEAFNLNPAPPALYDRTHHARVYAALALGMSLDMSQTGCMSAIASNLGVTSRFIRLHNRLRLRKQLPWWEDDRFGAVLSAVANAKLALPKKKV